MIKPTKLSVVIACSISALSQIQATECEKEISSSCDITADQTIGDPKPSGPLYIFKQPSDTSNKQPIVVNVKAKRSAHYRGEVFRIDNILPKELLVAPSCNSLLSDYDVISITEDSAADSIETRGSLISKYQRAIYVGPRVSYGNITVKEGSVTSKSEFFPAISIDSTASGALDISGTVHSERSSAVVYTTDAKHLWNSNKSPIAGGEHKLRTTIAVSSDSVNPMDAALSFGDINNAYIADTLPEYKFNSLSINGSLDSKNSGMLQRHGAVSVSDNILIGVPVHGINHAIRLGRR